MPCNSFATINTRQFMYPFSKCCQYCKLHIYGGSIRLRVRQYSHISIYLNFEVYMKFNTIYGNIFRYIWRALLLMNVPSNSFCRLALDATADLLVPCPALIYFFGRSSSVSLSSLEEPSSLDMLSSESES